MFIFDICYYLFIQHMVERQDVGQGFTFRPEPVVFQFLISLFSIFCVRIAIMLVTNHFTQSLALKYIIVLVVSFVFFLGVVISFQYVLETAIGQVRPISYYFNNLLLFGFMHLVVGNATVGLSYFRETLQLRSLIAQRDKRQAEMELQMLRQQMSPHFLFNNLNTLGSLISLNPDSAIEYSRRLAALYRYTTQISREEVVTLSEEMDFASDYFRLVLLRFGEVYILDKGYADSDVLDWFIVPMSMQTILENVIKHNAGSSEKPLNVSIRITDDYLQVSNEIRLKSTQAVGLGVGLKNLNDQFEMVAGRGIIVQENTEYFTVKLPLIKRIVE